MFFKLKLLTLNFASAILLAFFLCLGSQNLNNKYNINFIINKTVPLPVGFVIGTSFIIGFIPGGITSLLMLKNNQKQED
tara:strand:+ start:765 stop:1001 length:237 start_codon:yes stop_codon:yes gene_type:complete